ncbi:MAG: cold shock domain-containing protein [Cytophagaceae bacterium]|nr:MAG: cold shock domain-containing protein [Cytophagaceae bacterium]
MPSPTHGPFCFKEFCFKTRCKRCNDDVFYYQCSCGSKVFFDTLGDPWPRHDCSQSATRQDSEGNIALVGVTIGTVIRFDARRGYGYIVRHSDGEDVCVTVANLKASGLTSVKKGQVVEFEVKIQGDVPRAVNIRSKTNNAKVVANRPAAHTPSKRPLRAPSIQRIETRVDEEETRRRETRALLKQVDEDFNRIKREEHETWC